MRIVALNLGISLGDITHVIQDMHRVFVSVNQGQEDFSEVRRKPTISCIDCYFCAICVIEIKSKSLRKSQNKNLLKSSDLHLAYIFVIHFEEITVLILGKLPDENISNFQKYNLVVIGNDASHSFFLKEAK